MTARLGAALVVAVAALVAGAIAATGVDLLRSGDPVQVGVGAGLLVLDAVVVLLVVAEVRLGAASGRLARRLVAEGGLPVDPPGVARLPSGRLSKVDAATLFAARKAEVERDPDDWRAWWRLAVAYGDARDTTRGRRAMRRAVALERAERAAGRSAGRDERRAPAGREQQHRGREQQHRIHRGRKPPER